MEADSTDRSPENGAPESRLTLGVRLLSAWMSASARLCRASEVNALTAIGTSCSFSSRRSAVTTTSWISCATACAQPSTMSVPQSAWLAQPRPHFANEIFMLVFPLRKTQLPSYRPALTFHPLHAPHLTSAR